jgi:uncharacterized damage-inducible protein DinB
MRKETLTPVEGVPKQIGYYLAGMAEVREQLRVAVADLTDEENSSKIRPDAHSIGELILHCGEAEWWWIQCVVGGREIDDELKNSSFWDVLKDGKYPVEGYSAAFCMAEIDKVSALTRKFFGGFNDEDLDKYYERPFSKEKTEKSLRWILHHLIDHEAQHKGQILMLKRLLAV